MEKKPLRRFVLSDVHGNYKALLQCITRSGFNMEEDQLITLGDIADGYAYVYDVVELLLSIKNRIDIKGNHDEWFHQWMINNCHPDGWKQGGEGTLKSYTSKLGFSYGKAHASASFVTGMHPSDLPEAHRTFFDKQVPYYLDQDKNLFVHGGINRHYTLDEHNKNPHIFWWDRDLFSCALSASGIKKDPGVKGRTTLKFKEEFKNIFIGHTQTTYWGKTEPIFADRVINIDTGGGWNNGKVTIMNIDTKEFWQSDMSIELYPNEQIKRG